MLAFGGIGTVLGPILGATVFTIVDELLVDYAQLREVIYGVVTLVLFLSFRQGAVPAVTGAIGRLFSRNSGEPEPPSSAAQPTSEPDEPPLDAPASATSEG